MSRFIRISGRLTACTSRNGNTCPSGSQCMDTATFSQRLCCEQIEYTCPGYSTPYPSSRFPQKCNIMETWSCGDKQCMPSSARRPSTAQPAPVSPLAYVRPVFSSSSSAVFRVSEIQ
ncbi:hypothetical protein ANCCAN_12786 [Ancylostoma caninum]|uniref:Uncharacterized protein n=1 Tax=Ancylostoma caninum TaxID=29170 RepID=A0A368GE31_ANCCA|nr:hypothetical protein ANCCAN_12786 [Ancylostoma caninum]